ncbi:hypothetical protein Hanom_Chr06g00520991 [Helianthus anomalus]
MDNEFYVAFASPMTITQNTMLENETGTTQKPPKLMDIDDYNGWSDRFGNWVEAYHLDAWDHTEVQYFRPLGSDREKIPIKDLSPEEKKKYKDDKLMVSLLQQTIKEDILILLQHDGSAYSIWKELEAKSFGNDDLLRKKMSLMKKEFDLFSGLRTESTKQIIERYCNLVKNMTRLGINKSKDELIEKLADALPHDVWGTFLMMLRNNRKEYNDLTLGGFIKHLEAQEMEQRKIGSSESSSQGSSSKTGFSSFPSFDPHFSTTKSGKVLQCNIALNLENDQNYTEEVAKSHMSLLVTVLVTTLTKPGICTI